MEFPVLFRRSALLVGTFFATIVHTSMAFTPNTIEDELSQLIRDHKLQGRPALVQDAILSLVARAKAIDLGMNGYTAHTNLDGYGPNRAVRLAGYELPKWWPNERDSNYIESLAFGYDTATKAFDAWLNSPAHKGHVLGEDDFFKSQTRCGIGYAEVPGSKYGKYFVLLTAPPNDASNKQLEPYVEWLFEHYTLKEIETLGDHHDADGDGLSRMLEFALNGNPNQKVVLPAPSKVRYRGSKRLSWKLPLRQELGSLEVEAEFSTDLQSWDDDLVQREGQLFVVDQTSSHGFLRLKAER